MSNRVTKILMEAGAGAGKTYTLVKEIIKLLSEGKATPGEIGAITFTNAASSEMKGRIQEELLRPSDNVNLQKASENVDDLSVSTIHSFCNKILSLFPFELGFSLDKNIITDEKDIQKRDDELFESSVCDCEEFASVCSEFGIKTKLVKDMFFDMINSNIESWRTYENTDVNPQYIQNVKSGCLKCYNELLTIIKTSVHQFPAYVRKHILKKDTLDFYYAPLCGTFTIEEYRNTVNKLVNGLYKQKEDKRTCYIYKERIAVSDCVSAEDKEIIKAENEKCSAVLLNRYDELVALLDEYKKISLAVISNLMIKLVNIANVKKRDMSDITNDETLIYTKELLHKLIDHNVTVPKSLRYKYIFIDEFQDTDPVQIDIINSLGTLITRSDTDVTFYFIGDPKQSIYQFRGADLSCYLNTSKEINRGIIQDPNHYITAPLTKNFRSSPIMLDYFNHLFSKEGYFEVDKSEFTYTPTSPGFIREMSIYDREKILSGVYRSDMEVARKGGTKEDKESEALYVASLVKYYVDNEYLIYDKDEKYNVRKVKYSDFMIITPTNNQRSFLRSFGALNISVNLEGSEIPNTIEVRILLGMLKLLSKQNSSADIDKVFLEEVVLCKLSDEKRSDKDNQKLVKVYSFISEYQNKPVGVFLEDAVYFIGSIVAGDNPGQIVQVIEMIKSNNPLSYLDAYKTLCNITQINRRLKLEESNNAVKIINLHKAKGLQGGICILAGHLSKNNNKMKPIGCVNNGQSVQGIFNIYAKNDSSQGGNVSVYLVSPYMQEYEESEQNSRKMENKRLMYVAATRAKEMLIIMNNSNKDSEYNGYWADLMDKSVHKIQDNQSINSITGVNIDVTVNKEQENKQYYSFINKESVNELITEQWDVINPSKLKGIKEDKTDYDTDITTVNEQIQNNYILLQPLKGTVIHAMFENAVNRIKASADKKETVRVLLTNETERTNIIRYVLASTLLKEKAEYDFQKVYFANVQALDKHLVAFLCDTQMQEEIQKADCIYTELPFEQVLYDELQNNKTAFVIRGVMDLVLKFHSNSGDEYKIWDYKTNEKNTDSVSEFEKELYKEYKDQLSLYERTLFDIFAKNGEKINVLPASIYHLYR